MSLDAAPPFASAAPRPRRRVGLFVKTFALAVLPVLAVGALLAAILLAQRAATLNLAADRLANSVARVLATALDVQDLSLVNTQLQAAVSSESIAFVDVRPTSGGLRFFMSPQPDTDWHLRETYDRFLASSPDGQHFRFVDDRADRYREARAQVENDDPRTLVREHLDEAIARFEATRGEVSDFQVVRVAVFEKPTGGRVLRGANDAAPVPGATRLFDLGIGVRGDEMTALMNRQLVLVIGACALVALLAALFAFFAARRLVRPILSITAATNDISLGRIDAPVHVTTNDELGDLAQSVERLRVSLELALRRLRPHA